MSYELIIAEKPSAAKKIAASLADGAPKMEKKGKVTTYSITRNGVEIKVACAVGHLYGVAAKTKAWTYPIFDVEWKPTYETNDTASFAKPYLNNIKALAKKATGFVVACDLDVEGETIAYNILRFACGVNDAKRMKFSTMTASDLSEAYDNQAPHIIFGLANAGVTRHILDFYFGINMSRALSLALKSAGRYKILSAGRVQGPALAILSAREKEIKAFVPVPFWNVELLNEKFKAGHENGDIFEKEIAEKIVADCAGKEAVVSSVNKKEYKQNPPTPFNLSDLQMEAHKLFGMTPRDTQVVAQKLYEQALISYPRTSSQKLPQKLGLKSIVEKLGKNMEYKKHALEVLKTKMIPNEGKKTDDAHPSIYPTGEVPTVSLDTKNKKIYDLIVKRFFAVFGTPAIRESLNVKIAIGDHIFIAQGKRTVEENWFALYAPYVRLDEIILPEMKEGEKIDVKKIELLSKETKPPARYNEASIVRALEKENVGTKATRADIIGTLYKRGYLHNKRIEVTDLGMQVVETLQKHCPEIISVELTRRFENEMEEIEHEKITSEKVIDGAKTELGNLLEMFRSHEKEIGQALLLAQDKTQDAQSILGPCPKCGKDLKMIILRGRGRFVGCSGYPNCKTAFPLPRVGKIVPQNKICEKCNTPIIAVYRKGSRGWKMCLDPKCETKKDWASNKPATETDKEGVAKE